MNELIRLCEVCLKNSYFFSSVYWYRMDMVSKCRVVLLSVVCLLFKVILIRCEVTLVNRNFTDSFRVDKNGCTEDTNCTSSASCQSDSGLCLCNDGNPNFLYYNGASSADYQCVTSESIREGLGECLYSYC